MNLSTIKTPSVCQQILKSVESVVGMRRATLHQPEFSELEWETVRDTLDSTFVSSVGRYVNDFEIELATFTGAKFAVATVNGTAALHIALKLAGVSPGDEVLVPALSFVATANAVVYCGAIPHFVDSNFSTMGLDPGSIREYLNKSTVIKYGQCINKSNDRRIRAIIPMHAFGHSARIEELVQLAKDFNLELIEDAAESLGSFYKGKHTGTFGAMGILSFNGNKIITTGGGGAILCDDMELAKKAKHLTTTAKLLHRWEFEHDVVGYNYRLPNINAALGCAQIRRITHFLKMKRRLFSMYSEAFESVDGVTIFREPDSCHSNYWLQLAVLDESLQDLRDDILGVLNDAGYECRPAWKLLSDLAPFRHFPRMSLECAEALQRRLVCLPSSPYLAESYEK